MLALSSFLICRIGISMIAVGLLAGCFTTCGFADLVESDAAATLAVRAAPPRSIVPDDVDESIRISAANRVDSDEVGGCAALLPFPECLTGAPEEDANVSRVAEPRMLPVLLTLIVVTGLWRKSRKRLA